MSSQANMIKVVSAYGGSPTIGFVPPLSGQTVSAGLVAGTLISTSDNNYLATVLAGVDQLFYTKDLMITSGDASLVGAWPTGVDIVIEGHYGYWPSGVTHGIPSGSYFSDGDNTPTLFYR